MAKTYLLKLTEDQHARLSAQAEARGLTIKDLILSRTIGDTPVRANRALAYQNQTLSTEVQTLRKAMELAGLDDEITRAQALLARKETPHGDKDKDQGPDSERVAGSVRHARAGAKGQAK